VLQGRARGQRLGRLDSVSARGTQPGRLLDQPLIPSALPAD